MDANCSIRDVLMKSLCCNQWLKQHVRARIAKQYPRPSQSEPSYYFYVSGKHNQKRLSSTLTYSLVDIKIKCMCVSSFFFLFSVSLQYSVAYRINFGVPYRPGWFDWLLWLLRKALCNNSNAFLTGRMVGPPPIRIQNSIFIWGLQMVPTSKCCKHSLAPSEVGTNRCLSTI